MPKSVRLYLADIIKKIKWKELIALLMLLLAFVFFHSERREISELVPQIRHASPFWIFVGVISAIFYIILQALMYVFSFRAVGENVGFKNSVEIFLKRNLLSVFLPAGGITSLAYLPKSLRKQNIASAKVHKASSIYAFVGILSVVIVGVPLMGYAAFINENFKNQLYPLLLLILVVALFFLLYLDLKNKDKIYGLGQKYFPEYISQINGIFSGEIDKKNYWLTVFISVLIEFCGVFQVLVAMYALGGKVSLSGAALAYIISVVLMIVSPFLRGLGAVEFSLAYILTNFGFRHSEGLSITLLYRLFEFWLPLLAGVISYLWNGRKLASRLFPALLIFALGIINFLSVITPPIAERLQMNRLYFPHYLIHISKILTVVAGIMLIFTAASLIKGYRRAWVVSVVLCGVSIAGNLLKALDYEEAIFAGVTLIMLIYTQKEYRLRNQPASFIRGFSWFAMAFIAVVLMNFLSFYFIDPKHFGVDFTWKQSLYYTLHNFLFFKDNGLQPQTVFAKDFQNLNHILGIITWVLLIYSFYKASGIRHSEDEEDFENAKALVSKYGTSALDYFKLSDEKNLYFSKNNEGFVSFRHDKNFAVVLEEPVCKEDQKIALSSEFEAHCHRLGLRTCYYRVGETAKDRFLEMKKKYFLIGQEAIMDADSFVLSGKDRKSLRNGINSLEKKGYSAELLAAPHDEEILLELQQISDSWLQEFNKKEMVFAEGKFDHEMLHQQDVIVLKDAAHKILAFLNIIPDYAPQECTYDMIRRTSDAPNGSMDLLIVKLVEYAKERQIKSINLGLAPMSGLTQPENAAEQLMNFAYHRLGTFRHYQSLRFFKEKYASRWENKYLIYNSDADLLQIPVSLNNIMKL